MSTFDVIVIGGGPAGVTAALRARELGATVALVERDRMGGTCTNDGCVPTRVLAKAARLRREAEQCSDYGLVGSLPTMNFIQLLRRTQQTVYRIQEKKQLIKHLDDSGAQVFADVGPVRFADPHTMELAYPTFTAIVGLAARRIVHQLGVVPLAPEWRALATPQAAVWERRD